MKGIYMYSLLILALLSPLASADEPVRPILPQNIRCRILTPAPLNGYCNDVFEVTGIRNGPIRSTLYDQDFVNQGMTLDGWPQFNFSNMCDNEYRLTVGQERAGGRILARLGVSHPDGYELDLAVVCRGF
mgnify:FL=1